MASVNGGAGNNRDNKGRGETVSATQEQIEGYRARLEEGTLEVVTMQEVYSQAFHVPLCRLEAEFADLGAFLWVRIFGCVRGIKIRIYFRGPSRDQRICAIFDNFLVEPTFVGTSPELSERVSSVWRVIWDEREHGHLPRI